MSGSSADLLFPTVLHVQAIQFATTDGHCFGFALQLAFKVYAYTVSHELYIFLNAVLSFSVTLPKQ